LKKTPINKVSDKQKIELKKRQTLKADLLFEQRKICGYNFCVKCGRNRDLQLVHKIAVGQGGETSKENCYIGCLKCHGEGEHHLKIIMDEQPQW